MSPAFLRPLWLLSAAATLGILAGCASPPTIVSAAAWPAALDAAPPADVLLLGEQHDAPDHQLLERQTVQWLAGRGQLAALVLEMAERGHSTAGLPREATEAQVQSALQWHDAAWPWSAYGPVVMAAVRTGTPVLGGNLPRTAMAEAAKDAHWDNHLAAHAREQLHTALQEGHCDMLPAARLPTMARIQIARDASLAATAREAMRPGQTVLLVAGGEHVLRHRGVPTHWPRDVQSKVVSALARPPQGEAAGTASATAAAGTGADIVISTPPLPPHDACASLRPAQ